MGIAILPRPLSQGRVAYGRQTLLRKVAGLMLSHWRSVAFSAACDFFLLLQFGQSFGQRRMYTIVSAAAK